MAGNAEGRERCAEGGQMEMQGRGRVQEARNVKMDALRLDRDKRDGE